MKYTAQTGFLYSFGIITDSVARNPVERDLHLHGICSILEFFMSVRNRSHAMELLIYKILPLKILKLLTSNILRTLINGAIAGATILNRQ
ncbi:hypothetical protein [Microcoleus sp. F4-D5]|uniref:hypothetical protein n=1 Tax=Microcoleus sp. F4-D5 TaxID=2818760 RepID=UPI002FD724A9